jgi:hypothetical protein
MLKSLTSTVKKKLAINIILSDVHNMKQCEKIKSFTDLDTSIEKINFLPTTNIQIIRSGFLFSHLDLSYEIIRETLTNTYVINFPNIIILHIQESEYPYFLEKHMNNSDMLFATYKYDSIYTIICLSHLKSELTMKPFLEFLYENHCDPSHLILTSVFASFVVLNENYKRFYNRFTCSKELDNKIRYIELVGRGKNKYSQFQLIINYVNTYVKNTRLPTNYLKLPY